MVDFKAQLEKGFDAHEKASAAKKEINHILREIAKVIEEYTDGKVSIYVKRESLYTNTLSSLVKIGSIFSAPVNNKDAESQTSLDDKLVAYDKLNDRKHDAESLAYWSQSDAGYPCTLRFGGTKHNAFDRESLELVLGELLASSETGRIISSIKLKAEAFNDETKKPSDGNA
ncbi:hypothetical protein [Hoeflea ulvae]|uniref:Uncharacterized protein n=1 Tax=Hoeflea ulvae TaxID=2983764 RepID=A0ABT3YD85_9HYPH|nr:hypothetical protein [Hoeflea ulvae]MCY0093860.1 hypothetical protein [Hoeflea ulvae]